MINGPDGTDDHKPEDNNGCHVPSRTPTTPRGTIAGDPMNGTKDGHGEDHLN